MKVLNIVLCSLILIFAILSAAASYMLFEKRVQLVNGWNKMAETIRMTAAKMDEKSGTRIADELSAEALSHRKYAELDARLEKLKQQAADLIRQRNALAESLRKVGRSAEIASLPQLGALQAVSTSEASSRSIIEGVDKMRTNREQLVDMICRSARKVDVRLAAADLKSDSAKSAIRTFDDKVQGIRDQFAAYRSTLSTINAKVGGDSVTFDDKNYSQALAQIRTNVDALCGKLAKASSDIRTEQRHSQTLQSHIDRNKIQSQQLQAKLDSKDVEIKQYRRALGMDTSGFHPWAPGSAECRRAVRGKVVAVNDKFGYIGINLGTDSLVRQPLGSKSVAVNPKIQNGMTMYIARNPEDFNKIVYVGKVKLTVVDTDTSIAEALEIAPDHRIQVGDTVFMQEGFEKTAAPAKPAAKAATAAKK